MANMFRCTLASGGALILTVTCDSAFAGQTITCTDGTTTLTQICPSTSPYTVEFRIPNSGTWTISSGTDSTSVVIPDAIELHSIPEGSTVLPTDNIQTWLHCANICDKTYTTISQILSDASTLQALISSNNAADYMARSTTWASDITANQSAMSYIGLNDYCADALLANSTWLNAIGNSTYFESVLNVKVPTMTSNTTPSGVVSVDSVHENRADMQGYKVFDGDDSSFWISGDGNSGNDSIHWIQYFFDNPILIKKIHLFLAYSNPTIGYCNISEVQIQGSNDGENFITIKTINQSVPLDQTVFDYVEDSTNSIKYKYCRIRMKGWNYNYSPASTRYAVSIKTMQFYGRA